ncbi:pyridoxamine 5'-phosphate oxidase [Enemella dayhoffiae]|uniref:Pyridoxamine 5'-phosphate oxidase n=1 Tax=Enemella dayhoffiae TaxID=2016507 RepID=A0A255GUR3_9ACTN|nr:pyridoxamine 5'-phosphate oxidase family protein [Enemella dayhoffiae]OYO19370.1 pyridoxamine 5'-phosphate oxidase [Enemella dayhoffiae]
MTEHTHHDVDTEATARVHELIKDQHTAMLTNRNAQGQLVSRPMATQQTEFDGDVWLFAEDGSEKVRELQADPRVNLAYTRQGAWVSLSGTADIVHDPAKNRELWNDFAQAWFQCEPEDPKVVLIRVHSESAEYWDSPGKAATLFSMVKARVTGQRPDVGDNDTVDL